MPFRQVSAEWELRRTSIMSFLRPALSASSRAIPASCRERIGSRSGRAFAAVSCRSSLLSRRAEGEQDIITVPI